jgi:hypothetical protein
LPSVAKNILIDGAYEGLEEVGQGMIQHGVKDYYSKRMSMDAQQLKAKVFTDIVNSTNSGIKSQFSSEGIDNFLGGLLLGGGAQVVGAAGGSALSNVKKFEGIGNEYTYQKWNKAMNLHRKAFNATNTLFNDAAIDSKAEPIKSTDDMYLRHEKQDEFIHNLTLSNIKRGTYEVLIDGLKEWATPKFDENLTKESYIDSVNKFTNNQFKIEKVEDATNAFNSIIRKIERNKMAYNKISRAYSSNPFEDENTFSSLIKGITKNQNKKNEDAIKSTVWEFAKDQAIRLQSDLYGGVNRENNLYSKIQKDLTEQKGSALTPDHEMLLNAFLDNPIKALNNDSNKNANYDFLIQSLDNLVKENEELVSGLPAEYLSVLKERNIVENNIKFYKEISSNIKNGNIQDFYKNFHKLLVGEDANTDEEVFNDFVLNSTDVIKLRIANKFLHTATNTFTSVSGQKKLIIDNINNLGFYLKIQDYRDRGFEVKKVDDGEPEEVETTIDATPPIIEAEAIIEDIEEPSVPIKIEDEPIEEVKKKIPTAPINVTPNVPNEAKKVAVPLGKKFTQIEAKKILEKLAQSKRIVTDIGYIETEKLSIPLKIEIKNAKNNKEELVKIVKKNNLSILARTTSLKVKYNKNERSSNSDAIIIGNIVDLISRNLFVNPQYSFKHFLESEEISPYITDENIVENFRQLFEMQKILTFAIKEKIKKKHGKSSIFVTDSIFVSLEAEMLSETLKSKLDLFNKTNEYGLEYSGVAGTYDMLVIDENGGVHSFDFKTTKVSNGFISLKKVYNGITKFEDYKNQQDVYAELLSVTGLEIKNKSLILYPFEYENIKNGIVIPNTKFEETNGFAFLQGLEDEKNIENIDKEYFEWKYRINSLDFGSKILDFILENPKLLKATSIENLKEIAEEIFPNIEKNDAVFDFFRDIEAIKALDNRTKSSEYIEELTENIIKDKEKNLRILKKYFDNVSKLLQQNVGNVLKISNGIETVEIIASTPEHKNELEIEKNKETLDIINKNMQTKITIC